MLIIFWLETNNMYQSKPKVITKKDPLLDCLKDFNDKSPTIVSLISIILNTNHIICYIA